MGHPLVTQLRFALWRATHAPRCKTYIQMSQY